MQQLVPVHRLELQSVALTRVPILSFSAAQVPSVVMQRPSIDPAGLILAFANDLFEESTRPFAIVSVRSRGDKRKLLSISGDPCCIPAILDGILLGSKVAAAPPRLVANSPITDVEWVLES